MIKNRATFQAFSYLVAEKAGLYRAIMCAFLDAKERFALHLRPNEVLDAVRRIGEQANSDCFQVTDIEAEITQLCLWGNLEPQADTSDVGTVEEFYRPRFLYQLTADGEAVERGVQRYFETLSQKGELQTAALTDILALIIELRTLVQSKAADEGKIHLTLLSIRSRFQDLTERAQVFMRDLQRHLQLEAQDLSAFRSYKELLIGYLERFIKELVLLSAEIAKALEDIDEMGVEQILRIAAARDLADAVASGEVEKQDAYEKWVERWAGLKLWFIGDPAHPSQSAILRARARAAIPALLSLVIKLNERRAARSDRSADFRTLARWFSECDSEPQANQLWLSAFGLGCTRHLTIDQETLSLRDAEPVTANTSWFNAPSVCISPRLRLTGTHSRKGKAPVVMDRSKEKAFLAEAAREEAKQILEAHKRLATGQKMRISDLHLLGEREFDLFLDLLGEALSRKTSESEAIETASSDGSLTILLEPILTNASFVTVSTTLGEFHGVDHCLTIRSDSVSVENVPSLLGAQL